MGRWRRRLRRHGRAPEAARAARRAFATTAASFTPSTYVIDLDQDTDRLVVQSRPGDRSTTEDSVSV